MRRILVLVSLLFFTFVAYASAEKKGCGCGAGNGGIPVNKVNEIYDKELRKIVLLVRNKDFSSALNSIDEYIEKMPENYKAWELRALSSFEVGNLHNAELYGLVGLAKKPDNEYLLSLLGQVYIATDRIDLAKENLKTLNEMCVYNCIDRNTLKTSLSQKENNLIS